MSASRRKLPQPYELRLAVRLHDLSAELAIGLALLRGWIETPVEDPKREPRQTIEVFEQVLGELRHLMQSVSDGAAGRRGPGGLRQTLETEARSVGVDLELRVTGEEDWLADSHAELVRLVGQEAIRNVKRHSGTSLCRISIDLSRCPFIVTARDWGAGSQSDERPRRGLKLLQSLSNELGASLQFSSQPGLGVVLTLTGPRCGLAVARQSGTADAGLRSVVVEESVSSRKRVASTRPFGPAQQQIS